MHRPAPLNHLHKSPHFPHFNSSGRAAIRATGVRDKCVKDYSPGVGSSPLQVDYALALFFLCFSSSVGASTPTPSLTPLLLHWPMFNLCFPTYRWPTGHFSTKPAGWGGASYNWAAFVYTVVRAVYCQLNRVGSSPNMTSLFLFYSKECWILTFLFVTLKLKWNALKYNNRPIWPNTDWS